MGGGVNSYLKSPPPGCSIVSVLLQSSWEPLFSLLEARLHFSGHTIGRTYAVCYTQFHHIPNMIYMRTHTDFAAWNRFRDTMEKKAGAT